MEIVLVLDNIRSLRNVGAVLRIADGFGISQIIACGITPHTQQSDDPRLPHIWQRVERELKKTALGAEKSVSIKYSADTTTALRELKQQGFTLVAMELTARSKNITEYRPSTGALAIIFGNEVAGLDPSVLGLADAILQIPMLGEKESLNVASVVAISCFYFRNLSTSQD